MSDAGDRAVAFFEGTDPAVIKLNCGQSVLAALVPRLGIDRKVALGAARGFGGGIGHQGNVCGALCGAAIALGFARHDGPEGRNRSAAYADVRELFRRFRERYGETECRILIGIDPSTEKGEREIHERGIHRTHCTHFVRSAVEIAEDILARSDRRSEGREEP